MKQCPKCFHTYTDVNLNFCLEDGEMLTAFAAEPPPARYADDPPTMVMDPSRVTNPSNWPNTPPASGWQQQAPVPYQQQGFAPYGVQMSPSQTLAVVSLGLGIGSMTIGWCCSLGLLLAPGALITGFIALSQIKKDPDRYAGRGFALAGMSIGGVFLVLYILLLAFGILASIIK
ncbi:MAG TPA: DUF4190 domain-containing protein [Pyrinomonadaceae bacterium]|nr:DUF4190 domain-containing protein [Pyrinomonadaceae bacterium]